MSSIVVTEQPGRVLAIFVVAPFLMFTAYRLHMYTHEKCLASILFGLAVIFVLYEAFWILNYPPKRIEVHF